ncbi:MAG: DUF2752 domain-containing protein [Chloroflexota bacterium]
MAALSSGSMRAAQLLVTPFTAVAVGCIFGATIPVVFLESAPVLCPFRVLTGLPCPGCGMTRSVVAALHGDLSTSLFYHPLGPVMLALALLLAAVDVYLWLRPGLGPVPQPRGLQRIDWLMSAAVRGPAVWVLLALVIGTWLVRAPLYLMGTWTI